MRKKLNNMYHYKVFVTWSLDLTYVASPLWVLIQPMHFFFQTFLKSGSKAATRDHLPPDSINCTNNTFLVKHPFKRTPNPWEIYCFHRKVKMEQCIYTLHAKIIPQWERMGENMHHSNQNNKPFATKFSDNISLFFFFQREYKPRLSSPAEIKKCTCIWKHL